MRSKSGATPSRLGNERQGGYEPMDVDVSEDVV